MPSTEGARSGAVEIRELGASRSVAHEQNKRYNAWNTVYSTTHLYVLIHHFEWMNIKHIYRHHQS